MIGLINTITKNLLLYTSLFLLDGTINLFLKPVQGICSNWEATAAVLEKENSAAISVNLLGEICDFRKLCNVNDDESSGMYEELQGIPIVALLRRLLGVIQFVNSLPPRKKGG